MDNNERLKFMREWLKELESYSFENTYMRSEEEKSIRKKIECLGWAIKRCQQSVDRKRDREKSYW